MMEHMTGKNILVYNNSTEIAEKMEPLFAGEGMSTLTAADPEQLYQALNSREIHLMLIDVELNDKGWDAGIEMIASLREKSSIPLIVISAQSAETAKIMALEAGAEEVSLEEVFLEVDLVIIITTIIMDHTMDMMDIVDMVDMDQVDQETL